nr:GLUG motif-containing protein [uncultured Cohaesibacter sp.]
MSFLLASSALTALPAGAAGILPSGGNVAAGAAAIRSDGSAMTITQASQQAIVNWNSFSIGAGNSVTFVQPDRSSAILNRVTGSTGTSIAGSLSANGQVYLVNPNGIAITSSGTVKVGGGFVASTLGITDEDFLDGSLTFNGDGASASVSNEGVITVGRGGYAALMGGSVSNDGLVSVPLGKIGLGSGEQITLDLSGDGFMQVALPTEDDAEGEGALVENSGKLSANGGSVVMKAATAREAARQAINMSGVVEAKTMSGQNGLIVIGGGAGGSVTVSGKATASASKGKGGSIKISGAEIDLVGAELDASGQAGGGSVLVGGLKHGADGMQRANVTNVDADTVIRADATGEGDGGEVVVWSDELTRFEGTITALGAGSGSGGDAEVSGKQQLDYQGFTDLSAASGQFGTLLLDPYNLTISDDGSGSSFTASSDDSTLLTSVLEAALGSANVTVSTGSGGTQDGDITVASAIEWDAGTVLTLDAANDIIINADISVNGATGGLELITAAGDYSLGSDASVNFASTSASLTINGVGYTLLDNMADLDAIDGVSAVDGSAITQFGDGLAGHYALAGDLDASAVVYSGAVVGPDDVSDFSGSFTGLGHTISGLTIRNANAGDGYYGLFGASRGTIRNVGLVDGALDLENASSGVTAGLLVAEQNGRAISDVFASGSVKLSSSDSGTYFAGGLVGYLNGGSVSKSYSTASVYAETGGYSYAGGLVGYVNDGVLSNVHASGDVTASSNGDQALAGGLIASTVGTVENAYATGSVTASGGTFGFAGGLVALQYGAISQSYATGSVIASGAVRIYSGGLVGYQASAISQSYATGNVTASDSTLYIYAGGLVGYQSGAISQSYATGSAIASDSVIMYSGGLVGYQSGDISQSYASGAVSSGIGMSGGLVGYYVSGNLDSVYYDQVSTGQTQAVGNSPSLATDAGLTTDEARGRAYSGWDFVNVWYQTGDMRPILRSEAADAVDGVVYISNTHQLALMALDLKGSYALTGDIDASDTDSSDVSSGVWGSTGWLPLRTDSSLVFDGSLDGNGYAISGLTINTDSLSEIYAGLLMVNYGNVSNLGLEDISISGSLASIYGDYKYVGGIAGYNASGSIENSYVTGEIQVSGGENVYVGGLIGDTGGGVSISNSYSDVAITAYSISGQAYVGGLVGQAFNTTISYSYALGDVAVSDADGSVYVGGLVGAAATVAKIDSSYAKGDVFADDAGEKYVGGFAGSIGNLSRVTNSYAWGDVSVSPTVASEGYAGGFVGLLDESSLTNVYSTGRVSDQTLETTVLGGLVGKMNGSQAFVLNSFFLQYSGSSLQGVGTDADATGVTGLTQAQFQDTEGFMSLAYYWDFQNIWAPPSSGYYPELYALSPVVAVMAGSQVVSYGDSASALASNQYGGVGLYLLGQEGDSLSLDPILSTSYGATNDVGNYAVSVSGVSSVTSEKGVAYRVVYVDGSVVVKPRALTITADSLSKTYGDLASLSYSVSGLVNGDQISAVTLTAGGTDSRDDVGSYVISASDAFGTKLSNYAITYETGTLTVTPRALTITADSLSKTYGDLASLTYSVNGLIYGDEIGDVTLVSSGANAAAAVGDYAVHASDASGADMANYSITYRDGVLTVLAKSGGNENPGGETPQNPGGETPENPGAGRPLSSFPMAGFIPSEFYAKSFYQGHGQSIALQGGLSGQSPSGEASDAASAAGDGSGAGSGSESGAGAGSQLAYGSGGEVTGEMSLTDDPLLTGAVCFSGTSSAMICSGL